MLGFTLMADQLRAKRRGQAGKSWHVDETYVKVHGNWCYLYRAIDRYGNLVDSMVSEKRDLEAAKRFFTQAVEVVGHAPERVTTDGHDSTLVRSARCWAVTSSTAAITLLIIDWSKTTVGSNSATIRCVGSEALLQRPAFAEPLMRVRQFFRFRTTMKQKISLAQQRDPFCQRPDINKGYGTDSLTQRRMVVEAVDHNLVDFCILSSDTSASFSAK
jgi:putative transposase